MRDQNREKESFHAADSLFIQRGANRPIWIQQGKRKSSWGAEGKRTLASALGVVIYLYSERDRDSHAPDSLFIQRGKLSGIQKGKRKSSLGAEGKRTLASALGAANGDLARAMATGGASIGASLQVYIYR